MRLSAGRDDDADLIRARLRDLLAEPAARGWVPDDAPGVTPRSRPWVDGGVAGGQESGRRIDEGDDAEDVLAGVDDPSLPAGLGRHRAPAPTARLDPGRSGARALWLAAVVAVVLVVGWTWLGRPRVDPAPPAPDGSATTERATQPAAAPPVTPAAPPAAVPAAPSVGEVARTATTVVVAVVGQVHRPGLVTLPSGSRVADAVEAVGGLLAKADPASVNLAAVVVDGQQIAVGIPGATPAPAGVTDGAAVAGSGGPLDLNSASVADLDGLPGIGPVLAQRIVDQRERQGAFQTVDQLVDVPGIGPAVLDGLAGLVTV